MKCHKCGRFIPESDVLLRDEPSEVGWRRQDGSVHRPLITRKYHPRCFPWSQS